MNELETIIRAKTYIDKMANGIDPLTNEPVPEGDLINNVRIARCLFFVSSVLGGVIENGGTMQTQKQKSKPRIPFALSDEQKSKFTPANYPISITRLTKLITSLAENDNMLPLKYSTITQWLLSNGLICRQTNANAKNARIPTNRGIVVGISTAEREGSGGPYTAVLYDTNAQRLIMDNIDSIIAIQNGKASSETSKDQWNIRHDECLVDLYDKGVPMPEIAVTLKCSQDAVRNRLIELGILNQTLNHSTC